MRFIEPSQPPVAVHVGMDKDEQEVTEHGPRCRFAFRLEERHALANRLPGRRDVLARE